MQTEHRYRLGQCVALSPGFGYARKAGAVYEIVALLPRDRNHYQYRIRSRAESFERVAAENELTFRPNETLPAAPAAPIRDSGLKPRKAKWSGI
jgi:hypothetical protein